MPTEIPLEIEFTISSVQTAFNLVYALSLAEAIRQFVPETTGEPNEPFFDQPRLKRLPALLAFVFLFVPFFHGQSMYFVRVYGVDNIQPGYGPWLLLDVGMILLIAIMFFGMGRLLDFRNCFRFYAALSALLLIDILWASTTSLRDTAAQGPQIWVALNTFTLIVIGPFLIGTWNREKQLEELEDRDSLKLKFGVALCIIMVARTLFDYGIAWDYYFPKLN